MSRLEQRTRYDPQEVESRVLERWLGAGYFHPDTDGSADENYSIAIPPPNVTGALHMGHALNGSIQDVLIRYQRMRGRRTKWIFGTDHAGIATQTQVEKQLVSEGTSREQVGRDEFEQRVWQWREQYGSTIISQFQRLGASCDYSDERFTMDDGYVDAVLGVFVDLFDKGLIYRDNYMVNWDPGSGSAISELEVEDREETDTLYYIDYPLESGEGSVTVATVRPETMLADTAVAVNPGDDRFKHLVGKHVILPIVGRRLEVIADDHVKIDFGTGALKITPGHDPNDFEIGRRHELEELSVIGEDGRMTEQAGDFADMTAAEAGEAIVAALDHDGLISKREDYTHTVPVSHRSGARIEPLISLQWFMRMDELAKPAIEAVRDGRVKFTPERWGRVYLDWLENIRPWCISRQLWWGHRLPVWYCDACDETYVTRTAPQRCGSCDGVLRRDEDVLDTWFSSQLWPFATLGWPQDADALKAFYPTDVLITARDIIFLWVARMVMMGLEFTGDVPFADVNITSIIQAPDGRRMSKSLGTGIDPLDEIDAHGADAVRFGLLAMSSSQDVRYSAEKIRQGQQFANKMWNASRLVLMNAGDATPAPDGDALEDRWIRSRLTTTVAEVTRRIEQYDLSHAIQAIYSFFWNEFCDWYLEIVKPRLYGEDETDKRAVAANLLYVLEQTLALAHPFIPFVTEEIWSFLPGERADLVVSPYPDEQRGAPDDWAEREMQAVIEAVRALRNHRDLIGAPAASVLKARLSADAEALERYQRSIDTIGRLARFDLEFGDRSENRDDRATLALAGALVVLMPSDDVDPDEARRRREAKIAELSTELARAEGKLADDGFVDKAPEAIVQAERDKIERFKRELDELGA